MIRQEKQLYTKQPYYEHCIAPFFGEGDAVLDITASGRYWRTSQLKSVTVISGGQDEAVNTVWLSEKEADEYDMLAALNEKLDEARRIITYNGSSFDLPHLRRKYAAYGLQDPFLPSKQYADLFREYADIVRILGIPSRKLGDLSRFILREAAFPLSDENENQKPCFQTDDAERALLILGLKSCLELLGGAYRDFEAGLADRSFGAGEMSAGPAARELLVLTLRSGRDLPVLCSFRDGDYHVRFERSSMRIGIPVRDGMIRIYHTDIGNYEYLPEEGCAVHRSLAQYVDPSRKEKASRETCFHLAPCTEELLRDPARTESVIRSALAYLRSR